MRAPGQPPLTFALVGTISDAHWHDIAVALAERGINLDAATVGERPLRDVLQARAWFYGAVARLRRPPTPRERADKLQDDVAAYGAALARLVGSYYADGNLTGEQMLARVENNTRLQTALTQKIAEDGDRIGKLTAMGSGSNENARTVLGAWLDELTKLWLKLTGSTGPKRRQRLRSFLLACSGAPFPDMTTKELGRKIDNFIDESLSARQRRSDRKRSRSR